MSDVAPTAVLRVEPERLQALRQAFDDALNELRPHLAYLADARFIERPWLADPVSQEVLAHYNRTVRDEATGTYGVLLRYQHELTRIRDELARLEQAYVDTETANADLARRA